MTLKEYIKHVINNLDDRECDVHLCIPVSVNPYRDIVVTDKSDNTISVHLHVERQPKK